MKQATYNKIREQNQLQNYDSPMSTIPISPIGSNQVNYFKNELKNLNLENTVNECAKSDKNQANLIQKLIKLNKNVQKNDLKSDLSCKKCKGECIDIEDNFKNVFKDNLNDDSRNSLKNNFQDNQKNGKFCQLGSLNAINYTDFNKTNQNLPKKEENNNCEQLSEYFKDQMNQETKILDHPDQNFIISTKESCKLDQENNLDASLNNLVKESIINKTIVDARFKNDKFHKKKDSLKLNLIRNFFRFKQNTRKSLIDKYQFENQLNLGANLIESQLNNSISAPVILTTSNNFTNKLNSTMSTCSTNNSINDPATSASFNNQNADSLIVLKRTNSTVNNNSSPNDDRETWSKKTEFLLAVIGFAVDLGNVWRFPYVCYRNGGGAFLIPYLTMMLFGGLPLFYLELALGQYYRNGCLTLWKSICPMMKGIGYAICFIDLYMGMYYNTIISWALYYFCSSFTTTLPWTHCSNEWNTPLCRTVLERSMLEPEVAMNYTSPAQEFFERSVLEIFRSSGIEDIGAIKPSLAACLACVFLMVYFFLMERCQEYRKGASTGSSTKNSNAVWFTAIMPYILLSILLVRGLTLDGSIDGIRYYLYPQWSKLLEINVWIDAATQTFFSLGPGFGTLLALSSYNKFNNNCYKDAIITSTINCFTSILSGFVIFSVLGFMAKMAKKDISNVAADGPGLVFIVYPEAISTMRFSWFWSLLFFMMLITLGLDSTFGGLEAMITGLCDEYPALLRKNREVFVFCLILFIYVCALPTVTYGGNYIVNLLDTYGTAMSLLFVVLLESIAISWMYGSKKIARQIREMHGHKPGRFWTICWRYISPIFLFAIFISAIVRTKGLELEKYVYPPWSITLGWAITCSSMSCVPIYAIYLFFRTKGPFSERLIKMITPEPSKKTKEDQMDKPSQPSEV